MTLAEIRPDLHAPYRRRANGWLATVRRWPRPGEMAVCLADEDGCEWWGDPESFWKTFIHADLYDSRRN